MKFLPKVSPRNDIQRRADAYQAVLRYEAKLGGQLFGPIPEGNRREFFCLDKHTWVWHEEWTDANGMRQMVTTHYSVRPDGILKSQGGNTYQQVSDGELQNLYNAVKLYGKKVPADLRMLQSA